MLYECDTIWKRNYTCNCGFHMCSCIQGRDEDIYCLMNLHTHLYVKYDWTCEFTTNRTPQTEQCEYGLPSFL